MKSATKKSKKMNENNAQKTCEKVEKTKENLPFTKPEAAKAKKKKKVNSPKSNGQNPLLVVTMRNQNFKK